MKLGEVAVERGDVGVPLVALLGQHLPKDATDSIGERRFEGPRIGERLGQMERHHDRRRCPLVGRTAGEQVVEGRAQRVDVRAGVHA